MKLAEHRWVNVIWCDDIRNEVGNKPSFMGVYTGEMVFESVPSSVPKLCAFIRVSTPVNQPFKKLKIRVEKNDVTVPVGFIEVNEEEIGKAFIDSGESGKSGESEDGDPIAQNIIFVVVLGGLQILESSKWLKVFVDTEAETLESFKLRFTVNQTTELKAKQA